MAATTEADEFGAFVRRVLRAYARRVADHDIEAVAGLVQLQRDLDDALRSAVLGLRSSGYSWEEIGRRLGVTRQAAFQRFGRGVGVS